MSEVSIIGLEFQDEPTNCSESALNDVVSSELWIDYNDIDELLDSDKVEDYIAAVINMNEDIKVLKEDLEDALSSL